MKAKPRIYSGPLTAEFCRHELSVKLREIALAATTPKSRRIGVRVGTVFFGVEIREDVDVYSAVRAALDWIDLYVERLQDESQAEATP